MTVSLIVAVSSNGVIGHDGGLPWHLPADLKHFKRTTMGHHLIIGRRTWDEVGKPLPGRTMVVVTRSRRFAPEGAKVVRSVEQALEIAAEDDEPFIGGGSQIYRIALARDLVHRIYLTRIHAEVEGDTFFPEFDLDDWELVSEEHHEADEKNEFDYSFLLYERSR
ncbi:MAG: dihydrofolate reductase [Acidobacteria bacterium]|nr:dihydrofolate reductase [Candidatus Sulfomarinibacter kjeldsenii]